MVDRLRNVRSRLGLPTPCPECSDPVRTTYCGRCVDSLATILGLDSSVVLRKWGTKPVAKADGIRRSQ